VTGGSVTVFGPDAACLSGCGTLARRGRLTADAVRGKAEQHARLTGHVVEVESREVTRYEPGTASCAPRRMLTARELEIAALVAGGRTNKAIAAELVISLRTAETHVEHIMRKLGVSTRLLIAAWYGQQGSAAAGSPGGV